MEGLGNDNTTICTGKDVLLKLIEGTRHDSAKHGHVRELENRSNIFPCVSDWKNLLDPFLRRPFVTFFFDCVSRRYRYRIGALGSPLRMI